MTSIFLYPQCEYSVWVQHISDCRGSFRLFGSASMIFVRFGWVHQWFPAFVPQGVSHFLWSGGSDATSPRIQEVCPAIVSMQHSAANRASAPVFDQRHSARLNGLPTGCLQALSTPSDPICNTRPTTVAAHPIPVGLELIDAGREGFVPSGARLRVVDNVGNLPVVQLLLDPLRPRLPRPQPRLSLQSTGRDRLLASRISFSFASTSTLRDPCSFAGRHPIG